MDPVGDQTCEVTACDLSLSYITPTATRKWQNKSVLIQSLWSDRSRALVGDEAGRSQHGGSVSLEMTFLNRAELFHSSHLWWQIDTSIKNKASFYLRAQMIMWCEENIPSAIVADVLSNNCLLKHAAETEKHEHPTGVMLQAIWPINVQYSNNLVSTTSWQNCPGLQCAGCSASPHHQTLSISSFLLLNTLKCLRTNFGQ